MPDIWMDVDAALAEVPVNILPLIDDTDFVTIEEAVAYDAAGMDLNWNFLTPAGAYTQTNVTPTTGGNYDWAHVGNGMYSIEIPASGGADINNDTEGFGWFTGVATGILPWRGPIIGFRDAALNDMYIEHPAGVILGTAATGTLSTTVATTDLTGFADDELIGRTIIFTSGTAVGQASDITDYASSNGTVTFTAIETAPANGDKFRIV